MSEVEKRIKQTIKRFDICSLLKLLQEIGYPPQDIYFQSNSDLSSRATLCEDIFFSENRPRVTIVLNLGLLSSNSPLPNFFRKKMDSGSIDPILFTRFLHFFDHHVIKNLLSVSMPDLNNFFFSDWRQTQSYYLKLLDLNSTSTLWHLFQICFPELIVKVEKSPLIFKEKSSSIMLGTSRLGLDSFLGKKIEQAIPSFKITLVGESITTDMLVPWPIEVKRRLKHGINHLLERTSIHFRVSLTIKSPDIGWSPTSGNFGYLGYCRIGKGKGFLKLLLFSGYATDLPKLRI